MPSANATRRRRRSITIFVLCVTRRLCWPNRPPGPARRCSPGGCRSEGNMPMNDLFAFLTQLMTEHAALFENMGSHMFRGFAVILIAWFGARSTLASASGGHGPGFHFDHFASLLMTIAFGFGMITYYSRLIPGFGVSFYHLFINQGLALANQL